MAEAIGTAQLVKDFRRARNAGVPLVAIETIDPTAVIGFLAKPSDPPDNAPKNWKAPLTPSAQAGRSTEPAVLIWDAVNGITTFNKPAEKMLEKNPKWDATARVKSIQFHEAMVQAQWFEEDAVIFAKNAHRQLVNPIQIQAVSNLRDQFKFNGRSLVLLGPKLSLPEELKHDVIMIYDPLPDRETLGRTLVQQYQNADLPPPDAATLDKGIDAMAGLGAFESEQNTAVSIDKNGVDMDGLWKRKCKTVAEKSQGGLQISLSPVRFADMGGNEQVKDFGNDLIKARTFSAVWFIDEIEKDMSAIGTDTSGVTDYQNKKLLTFTQKHKIKALLLIGQPGSGKTLFAQAIAGEAGVPLCEMDMGGLKGKHVGESEQNTDQALETLMAISQGKILLVATCNDVGKLGRSPELLGRFRLPKFYFDLPTPEEQEVIFQIAGKRYGVDVSPHLRADYTDWNGREIDSAVETAATLQIPLAKSMKLIIPMAKSSAPLVAARREAASGNYLSSTYPGTYYKEGPRADETDDDAPAVAANGGKTRKLAGVR